jgi:hypothetical protein
LSAAAYSIYSQLTSKLLEIGNRNLDEDR